MSKHITYSLVVLFCLIQLISLANCREYSESTNYFYRSSRHQYEFCLLNSYYAFSEQNTHLANFTIHFDRRFVGILDIFLYEKRVKSVAVEYTDTVHIKNIDLSTINYELHRNYGTLVGKIMVTQTDYARPVLLRSSFYIEDGKAIKSPLSYTCNVFRYLLPFYSFLLIIGLVFMAFIFVIAAVLIGVSRLRRNKTTLKRGSQYEIVDTHNDRKVSMINSSPQYNNNTMHYPVNDMYDEEIPSTPPPYVEPQSYFTPNNPMIPSYPNYMPLTKQ